MKVPKKPLLVGSLVVTMAMTMTGCRDDILKMGAPHVAYGVCIPYELTQSKDVKDGLADVMITPEEVGRS